MISVTILTKNSSETIGKTLDSCRLFPEVLLWDTGSTDNTLEIAKNYSNVRIVKRPFEGFGPSHNSAAKEASHDWILSIDSDEILSRELIEEIQSLPLDPAAVYSIFRSNFFRDRCMKGCSGWYPDRVVRLFHRKSTRFSDDAVHESVLSEQLNIVPLKGELLHTPYRSIECFLAKMQIYSSLFAEQHAGKKRSSLTIAIFHGLAAFFKNYFLKRGFLNGKEGFIISLYNAHSTYYKYLKLAWRNNSL
jgi:glycosyltransferase involved in cell wall biosynthesis